MPPAHSERQWNTAHKGRPPAVHGKDFLAMRKSLLRFKRSERQEGPARVLARAGEQGRKKAAALCLLLKTKCKPLSSISGLRGQRAILRTATVTMPIVTCATGPQKYSEPVITAGWLVGLQRSFRWPKW